MSMEARLLDKAIDLSKRGQKADARRMLQSITQANPENEIAWLWLIDTYAKPANRLEVVEQFLLLCPRSKQGRALRQKLLNEMIDAEKRLPGATRSSHERQPQSAVRRFESVSTALPHPMVLKSQPRPAQTSNLTAWMLLPIAVLAALLVYTLGSLQARLEAAEQKRVLEVKLAQEADKNNTLVKNNQEVTHEKNEALSELQKKQQELVVILEKLRSLESQYQEMEQQYKALAEKYLKMETDARLQSEDNNNLRNEQQNLKNNISAMQNEMAQLRLNILDWEQRYNELASNYSILDKQNSESVKAYNELLEHYKTLDVKYQELLAQYNTILAGKSGTGGLAPEARQGSGTIPPVSYPQEFGSIPPSIYPPSIDSTTFVNTIKPMFENAISNDAFIHQVWSLLPGMAGRLTSGESDSVTQPIGNITDKSDAYALLFVQMIKAAPVKWDVRLVYMDRYHPAYPESANHVVVYLNTGWTAYYIETTSQTEMTPYSIVKGWEYSVSE
jgi:hypothetical protein